MSITDRTPNPLHTAEWLSNSTTLKGDTVEHIIPDYLLVPLWTLFWIIWSFGIIANSCVAIFICKMKTIPLNVFIIALCCSDIVSAIVSPFIVYPFLWYGEEYRFPRLICKSVGGIQTVTSAVTIQLVLVLSIWRLIALIHPHKGSTIMTTKRAKCFVVCIWSISTMLLMPRPVIYRDIIQYRIGKKSCFYRPEDTHMMLIYVLVVEIALTNVLPISAIIVICIAIAICLLKQKVVRQQISGNDDSKKERRALIQVTLIVVSFLIGYIPKTAYYIYGYVHLIDLSTHIITYVAALGIRNITESLNPILYVAGSTLYRDHLYDCMERFVLVFRSAGPRPNPPVGSSDGNRQMPNPTHDLASMESKAND